MIGLRNVICIASIALVLGSCTSRGNSLLERLAPLARESVFGKEEPKTDGGPITRELLNQIPFATIALSSEATKGSYSIVVPVVNNGGYLTYQDVTGSSIVVRGALVTATHGLPKNLSAVKTGIGDPIINQAPVADWPKQVSRNYQFALLNTEDFEVSVVCTLQPVARERIEIFELFFDVIRVEETCRNPVRTFNNTYWAAPETGFVWKSVQWVGPQTDPIIVEIVRPFAG